ncbi:MAG: hypothetical protein ACPL07_00160 [Candidatus Bathyarchaeia archaeon]
MNDVVKNAGDTIRVVIHIEHAYDILDELASNPKLDTLADALSKISRLVIKVLNDLKFFSEKSNISNDCKDAINSAISKLQWWFKVQDELYNYIKDLNDEKKQRIELKRFAAYTLAPDPSTIKVVECKEVA